MLPEHDFPNAPKAQDPALARAGGYPLALDLPLFPPQTRRGHPGIGEGDD